LACIIETFFEQEQTEETEFRPFSVISAASCSKILAIVFDLCALAPLRETF
jgi:hypothetical protein